MVNGYVCKGYHSSAFIAVFLVLFATSIDLTTSLNVRFHRSSYSVNEGDQILQPQLILNESSVTNITVLIKSIDITATGGGVDYNSGPYNVMFPAGETNVSFDVTITNDNVLENNETFNLTIVGESLPNNVTVGKISQTTVTIVNDGGSPVSVSFNQSTYMINENDGLVQPVLVLNNSVATDITLQVITNDITVTGGGVDYNSGPYNVTFPAGVTSVSFDVTIINDNVLGDNETFLLTIVNSSLSNQGFIFTTGGYDKTTVSIIDTSKPSIHPMSIVQYENTTVTLSCKATASGNIRYQWRRVNGEISSDRANGVNTSTLTISPVTEQDEDEYYCVASYATENGTLHYVTSNKANIIVYGPPMVQLPPVSYMRVDGSFELECIAINDPQSPNMLRLEWFKRSARITRQDFTTSRYNNRSTFYYKIIKDKVNYQLSGTYTCSVHDSMMNVNVKQRTIVIVEVPVVITTNPQAVVAVSGESVTLLCKATGSNLISYQWKRALNREISSDRANGVNTSTLTISPVTEQDEDEYYCVASNGGADGSLYEDRSHDAIVTVYGPPINQQFNPFYYVIAGDKFTLNCTASNPQSRGETIFSWYRNNEETTNLTKIIARNKNRGDIISTSQLYIDKLDSDQNSGRYICLANDKAISTTTVIVEIANFRNSTVKILETQNIDQSRFSSTVNLPSLDIFNNTVSHLFVVVTTDQSVIPYQVADSDLVSYNESVNMMYVAAVVSNTSGDQWIKRIVIGDGSSYHYNGMIYYNAPLIKGNVYYAFVRAYSSSSTDSNVDYATSGLSDQITVSGPSNTSVILITTTTSTTLIAPSTDSNSIASSAPITSSTTSTSTTLETLIDVSIATDTVTVPSVSIALSTFSTSSISSAFNTLTTYFSIIGTSSYAESYSIPPASSTSTNTAFSSSATLSSSSVITSKASSSSTSSSISSTSRFSSTLSSSTSSNIPSTSKVSSTLSSSTSSSIPSTSRVSSTLSSSTSSSIPSTSRVSSTLSSSTSSSIPSTSRVSSTLSSLTSSVPSTLSTSRTPTIADNDSSSDGNSGAIGAVIGVVCVLIIIIVIIVILILVLMKYKKRYQQLESVLASPVSTKFEIPLHEHKLEKTFSAESKALPLIMVREEQIKTSVGQPTTLHIIARGEPMPEINWTKDGEPINYPIQEDGSLYIYNTTSDDQGCYTVTAINSEGESSQPIQLLVLNPEFMPSDADKKPIKVEDFAEHLAMLQSNMNQQFRADYDSLVSDTEYTFHAAKLGVNMTKNRYKNILAYDHSRVVLKLLDKCPGSDYINASFIDGYNEKNAYIACQGPMDTTIGDFWRMVWEKCINTVVMITNLNEEGKPKCAQYWPSCVNECITCDNITVTLVQEDVLADYTIRKIVLKMSEDNSEAKGVSLEVNHFHYTVWPDHGVPKYATSMLLFHKCVFEHHKRKLGSPLLIHCSAGVGRTGTFIAIDVELQRIKQEGVVDVYNTVYKLRYKRTNSVQTLAQYMFVFDALMESIMCGDNSINAPTNVAKERLEKLVKVNPATKLSGYEAQFKKLEGVSPKVSDFTYESACLNQNWHKNRSMKCLPPDSSRVYITRDKFQSDYICASYIDGYHHRRAFMTTEGPMDSTLVDFWTMIFEKKSHVIVMLSLLEEDGAEISAKYWPNQGDVMEVGQYIIENTSETMFGKYFVRRILKVYNNKSAKDCEPQTVHQFHYLCWPDHSCPSEASSIMDLIELVEKVQRQTNNGPITVHCSDGMGRTGTFCAVMLCRERLLTEHMADVFFAIKTIRVQRPRMVENSEQYKFIHKTLIETMDRLASYDNLRHV